MAETIYNPVHLKLQDILIDIDNGRLGLPDLQRPFVWNDAQVRDLFDSMLNGYPIGYLMIWEAPPDFEDKSVIGLQNKKYSAPKEVIIDGQQRLTALYSSIHGIPVKDKKYRDRQIRIAFSPLSRKFQVWSKAYENTPEYIPDVSAVFAAKENNSTASFRKQFLNRLNSSREKRNLPLLTDDEESTIENHLNELLALHNYTIPTLGITMNATEEDVAEIFVRVNSMGQKLNQDDFILTLVSVYNREQRDRIEKFCEDSHIPRDHSSYNSIMRVYPSHLVRIAVGIGFRRAHLRYAYMILRGKDLRTGIFSDEIRNENLKKFKESLDLALDLNNWHAFLNIVKESGYLSGSLISSKNAVVFTYILFLLGKYSCHLDNERLRKVIARWFFMVTLTGHYSGNFESEVERQFTDLELVHSADEFVGFLENTISSVLTNDYFEITLPNDLITSRATAPSWNAFVASQIILGHKVLFSQIPLSQMFVLGSSGTKSSLDKHHIFPKKYLANMGIELDRQRNQVANLAYIDYQKNINIGDKAPSQYFEEIRQSIGYDSYSHHLKMHAIPENFGFLDYSNFLEKRRLLMAKLIRKAYEHLCHR
ncbi:MAG: DUF262 domain-containing protein [Clostridiaceae bacterium]|nr:DUF262 domain-containing protein [Clostridiaceae bacterium]